MDGITRIAGSISADLEHRLPGQRKTQREKLALLVATMLDVRSVNLMDLAAGLPRAADRTAMRYQWITRLLSNPLVISDEIMEPFAREVLDRAAAAGEAVVLILDQSKVSDRHQVLMLALRFGERALPLTWRVEATAGAIGFETQKARLEAVVPWLPTGATIRLRGDRFYGTADLIGWCQDRNWDYRLPLKGNRTVFDGLETTTTAACAKERIFYLEDVELTAKRAPPTLASSTTPAIPSPGSSRCPNGRATCASWNTARGGASSRCSRISSRAASASKTHRSATPTVSTASSWSWPSPSTGRCPPDSGRRCITPHPTKKA